ncbi:MAG: ComEC/Rec2 family competence protein, partial [Methylococcales bacterium]|nr:ComEC/Rec2 family competence protein [Methylococcales bacterium]
MPQASIEGIVASIPKETKDGSIQFQFELQRLNQHAASALLWMNCFQNCPTLHVGERWRFQAKLKQPQSAGTPGGFNFKNWLDSNHLSWCGTIKKDKAVQLDVPRGIWRFQAFRSHLADHLATLLAGDETLGLIQGLTLGVASHIDKSQWDLFRRTGTTHLVVISGEHIGLIAGFFYIISQWIWSRLGRAALFVPAPRVAGMIAFIVAAFYAWLSGLGAPVERALIAFGFVLLRYVLSQRFTVWQAWRYALGIIVLIEPHTVLTPGFYLSFLAVAILMTVGRRFQGGYLKQMFLLQAACLFGLMPVTLYAFTYGSLNGYLVNLWSIPWVGLVIVPLALGGLVLSLIYPWSGWLWLPNICSHWFLMGLTWFERFEFINLEFSLLDLTQVLAIL